MEKILAKIDQLKWLDVISAEPESISVWVALVVMAVDAKLMCLVVEPTGHRCNCPGCIDYAVRSVNTFLRHFRRYKRSTSIF